MVESRFDHLPTRIARARHTVGPLWFLNPTARYVSIPARSRRQHGVKAAASDAQDGSALFHAESGSQRQSPGPRTHEQQEKETGLEQKPPIEPQDGRDTHHDDRHDRHHHHHPDIFGAYQVWRSRDNRKGRHAIVLTRDFVQRHQAAAAGRHNGTPPLPPSSDSVRGVLSGLARMAVRYPVWDISYDVAMLFTIGSAVWVINSFFVWLPLAAPQTAFPGESSTGGGASALVGATIFEVGAIFGLLEAVNENRADCFGWALEEALESGRLSLHPSPDSCRHAHAQRTGLLGSDSGREKTPGETTGDSSGSSSSSSSSSDNLNPAATRTGPPAAPLPPRRWTWWPTWRELRTVYAHEMGVWANAIQLLGASVFWISGVTGLPPIYDRLSPAAADGIFWLPQVVGGIGFIVSSAMLMLETQTAWYRPALTMLGWHIGFWNLVGAVGFTLCGALGFGASSTAVAYASTLSTFVGSWAFLVSCSCMGCLFAAARISLTHPRSAASSSGTKAWTSTPSRSMALCRTGLPRDGSSLRLLSV